MDDSPLIKNLVEYIVDNAKANSVSGNYIFYSDELCDNFGFDEDWLNDNTDDIISELYSRIEVCEADTLRYDNGMVEAIEVWIFTCYL